MSEIVDRIYCGDNGNNALAAAMMAGQHNNNDAALAAMMNNSNNWMNNPFAYLIWLIFAGRMFGDNNCGNGAVQNAELQNQIQNLRNQIQDNQNSNMLMGSVKENSAALAGLAQVASAAQLGNCQQTNILQQAINNVATGQERGFSAASYATQQQTCDIINNQNANTQKIVDLLNGHWSANQALEIQDLKFQNSQLKQNQYLAGLVTGNCQCAAPAGL